MKPLIFKTIRYLIGFLTLICTFGCGISGTTLTQSANTLTPTVNGTNLPHPTVTSHNLLPTSTVSPTKTKPIIIVPVSPTSPTLSSLEAQSLFLNLLENNGGCKLPCWLGLTPGKTTARDANLFIETLANISKGMILNENGGYLDLYIPQNGIIFTPRFEYHFTTSNMMIDRLTAEILAVRKIAGGFEYAYGDPNIGRLSQTYSISNILSTYGDPSDVLVFGDRRALELELLLSYSDAGFLINYHAPLERVGETYLACPYKAYVVIRAWDPKHRHSLKEAASLFFGNSLGEDWLAEFLPIEDATGLDGEGFFNEFQKQSSTSCLETAVSLWLEP